MSVFPITKVALQKLIGELKELKEVERPKISKAIGEAREHGDLKENAEYHSAREKQGFIEARIRDLEAKLAAAYEVDVSKISDSKVRFGATVTIFNLETEVEVTYKVLSDYEADLTKNYISIASPIAMALLGKEEGDEVKVTTPNGLITYEIVKVLYIDDFVF